MHRQLREELRRARGESTFVLAANVDIRGFSAFFTDSSQAAAFLGYAYTAILDKYFPEPSFFKPTGDGLLMVWDVERQTLETSVQSVVDGACLLDKEFSSICAEDELINFETPSRVGIGIARGTATRLSGGDGLVLDYSGRPLNLASRLMDLARPHGVVFDESLGTGLLTTESSEKFLKSHAYIKGLSDTTPLAIYVTPDVVISAANKQPIGAESFLEDRLAVKLRELSDGAHSFIHRLKYEPLDPSSLSIRAEIPSVDSSGRKSRSIVRSFELEKGLFYYEKIVGQGPAVTIQYRALSEQLAVLELRDTWEIRFYISYSIPLGLARPELEGAAHDAVMPTTPAPRKKPQSGSAGLTG